MISEPSFAETIENLTARFFGPDTPLKRAVEVGGRPYEPRPQQQEMARRTAHALAAGEHLCVEAPTGVGKTFAYLVPAVYLALESDTPILVSTHTISLQEQIVGRDVPVLQKLMGVDFRCAVAKGRRNYLCLRRLEMTVRDKGLYLPSPDLVPETERIRQWAETSDDGSLSDLEWSPAPEAWDAVCCEVGNCLGARCPHVSRCFLMQARRKLQTAQIIVANHALFFSDMALRNSLDDEDRSRCLLPPYAAVIFDEAHTLEDTAATHLGLRLTRWNLRRLLHRLYRPETGRGLLFGPNAAEAQQAVAEALSRMQDFFGRIAGMFEGLSRNVLRVYRPLAVPDFLSPAVETVETLVKIHIEQESDEARRQELRSVVNGLLDFRLGLDAFLQLRLQEHVYWLERTGSNRRGIALNAAPIEIAPLLREFLFSSDFVVVMTSATLAVRGRMDYFLKRVGAEGIANLVLDSPFDFVHQVTLYVPREMPNPNDLEHFIPAACKHVRHFLEQTQGKAFLLFTSYEMMRRFAGELEEFFRRRGIALLVQGEGVPRSRMLEIFRKDVNSVIFGTSSFWTGVDVPGEALSNVIIVKLPFPVPDDPLVQAREESIREHGGRPFWDYALPEAVLRFRQGFGRLIRSRTDTGIVVVLDNRLVRSSYGRFFLESIPDCSRRLI